MREPSPGFEHESEKLERAAIKRARDEEINWRPANALAAELQAKDMAEAFDNFCRRMRWTDLDTETK